MGGPAVAYYDATKKDLKLARCDHPAGGNETISTLDSAGDVGRFA